MTFIITIGTRDAVFQVADTRLTAVNGTYFDDENVKTTVVHCSDSKLLISYTGLAQIENTRTDIWLVNLLKEHRVWEKSFPATVKFIETELTKAISRDKNLSKYSLTFVIGGLGINKGVRDYANAVITNREDFVPKQGLHDHEKIDGKFGSVFNSTEKNFTFSMQIYGAIDPTPEMKSLRRQVQEKIVKAKTPQQLDEIMTLLVDILRAQKKSPHVGKFISDDCTVAHIGSDYKGYLFSFNKGKKTKRYPNIVSPSQLK